MGRADVIHRAIAKAVDILVAGSLCTIPSVVGVFAGSLYMLISDGFFDGRSLGKRLVGLRVLVVEPGKEPRVCAFRDSMIRNTPFAAAILLGNFPLIGWFLFMTVGLALIGLEAYFAYADDQGERIGDIFAGSHVVDDARPKT